MEYANMTSCFSWCFLSPISLMEKSTNPVVFFQKKRRRDSFFAWPFWWSNSFRACSPAVVSLGRGGSWRGEWWVVIFSMLPSLKAEKRLMLQKSCAGVRNADWFSSMPSSRCSKRALKVPCGPFERRIFWGGEEQFFGGSSGVWAPKKQFSCVTYIPPLKGFLKSNSSYLFIWGHLEGFSFRG